MGEFATRTSDGKRVKIGTCEMMYYLRYDDRDMVQHEEGNVDAARAVNLFWRLPFPDEDNDPIGQYRVYNRGLLLPGFEPAETSEDTGIMQATHEAGLLINIKCYHGIKLPESSSEVQFHFNGKDPDAFELAFIKNTAVGIRYTVRCKWCDRMWSYDFQDIEKHIQPGELKDRLRRYSEEGRRHDN